MIVSVVDDGAGASGPSKLRGMSGDRRRCGKYLLAARCVGNVGTNILGLRGFKSSSLVRGWGPRHWTWQEIKVL